MLEITFTMDTPVPSERILAAATDFSERRPERWADIDPNVYRVHGAGDTWAEVTEGERTLGGIWARERYDWSTPGVVRAEVQDSNVFGTGSSWELRAAPREVGGSTVHWTTHRVDKGFKGRFLVLMMRLAGRQELRKRLRRTLDALEAPDPEAGPSG
ncbi:MAG: SRPBCC family protein [Actinomycetota bacterium]